MGSFGSNTTNVLILVASWLLILHAFGCGVDANGEQQERRDSIEVEKLDVDKRSRRRVGWIFFSKKKIIIHHKNFLLSGCRSFRPLKKVVFSKETK